MTEEQEEEEQEEQEHENKRIRPRERALGQKRDRKHQLLMPNFEFVSTSYGILITTHH